MKSHTVYRTFETAKRRELVDGQRRKRRVIKVLGE